MRHHGDEHVDENDRGCDLVDGKHLLTNIVNHLRTACCKAMQRFTPIGVLLIIILFNYIAHYNHYAPCTGHVYSTLIHCFVAAYGANPISMYRNTECFARDSNPATAPQMIQQSSALSSTPFRHSYCVPLTIYRYLSEYKTTYICMFRYA